jgi:hypothetical protein
MILASLTGLDKKAKKKYGDKCSEEDSYFGEWS